MPKKKKHSKKKKYINKFSGKGLTVREMIDLYLDEVLKGIDELYSVTYKEDPTFYGCININVLQVYFEQAKLKKVSNESSVIKVQDLCNNLIDLICNSCIKKVKSGGIKFLHLSYIKKCFEVVKENFKKGYENEN